MPSEPKKAPSLKELKKRKREEAAKAHRKWCLESGFAVPDDASEDAGQPVTVTNPCDTGKSASIQPLHRTRALPRIPFTPLGSIDTIGAMIRVPPARQDIEKLKKQAGWTVVTRPAGTIK